MRQQASWLPPLLGDCTREVLCPVRRQRTWCWLVLQQQMRKLMHNIAGVTSDPWDRIDDDGFAAGYAYGDSGTMNQVNFG